MNEPVKLPELPLMLADLPRPVGELLLEAGVPCLRLPDLPLLAAGIGRFVLFDSKSRRSSGQAHRAAMHGLKCIDLRQLFAGDPAELALGPESLSGPPADRAAARTFLEQLKTVIESQGGTWVRLGDFPFPYQSAICVGVEHVSEELDGFPEIAAALPGRATHFVSTRLRADKLQALTAVPGADLGWQVAEADCENSARSTQSHWMTRMRRFAAAGLQPAGLALGAAAVNIPGIGPLTRLGLRYACHCVRGVACRAQSRWRGAGPDAAWIRFCTSALPPRESFLEWVGGHYQSGCPLFLSATTDRLDLVQELLRLAGDAGRCSLMWQTTFGDFSSWWEQRRRLRLHVWRTEAGHEIHTSGEFGPYPWAVEIWRGQHCATLPLRETELVVPDEGLVYLQSPKRTPAGCTLPGDAVRNLAAPPDRTGSGCNPHS